MPAPITATLAIASLGSRCRTIDGVEMFVILLLLRQALEAMILSYFTAVTRVTLMLRLAIDKIIDIVY